MRHNDGTDNKKVITFDTLLSFLFFEVIVFKSAEEPNARQTLKQKKIVFLMLESASISFEEIKY